jgi:uncharacterized damage-inducible protein DinB
MKWQQLMIESYQRISKDLFEVLDGLSIEELHKRPSMSANPVGWLAWHVTRSCDRLVGDVILGEQLWIKNSWHRKFRRPPDLNDTGVGHTNTQVDSLFIPDINTLEDYHKAVMEQIIKYLENLTEKELDREAPNSQHPGTTTPVYQKITGGLVHNLQHVGQAAYVRGLVKGHGWAGR